MEQPNDKELLAIAHQLFEELGTVLNVMENGAETPEDREGLISYAEGIFEKAKKILGRPDNGYFNYGGDHE